MAQDDLDIDVDDLKRRMDGAMTSLKSEFQTLRTGRAAATMLDPISVEAYGQRTPINQVGTVNVPESRMLTINVWDKTMVQAVEKAIRESGLGINPVVDGTIIRLPIPELNEERRRELAKQAKSEVEEAKISIRAARKDANSEIKNIEDASEDLQKNAEMDVQKLTDAHVKKADELFVSKEIEILKV